MLSDEMTHDSFDFVEDLTQPIYFFLAKAMIEIDNGKTLQHYQQSKQNQVSQVTLSQDMQLPRDLSHAQLDLNEDIYLIPPEYQLVDQLKFDRQVTEQQIE